jgi:hypothetical protein
MTLLILRKKVFTGLTQQQPIVTLLAYTVTTKAK